MSPNKAETAPADAATEAVLTNYRALVQMLAGARPSEILETSVTMAQVKVLMLLSVRSESRMSELAALLHLSLSTVSGLVDRLVESDLATRRTDANDRRQVIVALSDEGAAFLERFQELGVSHLRELLAAMPADGVATVSRALELLIEAAQALPMEEPR